MSHSRWFAPGLALALGVFSPDSSCAQSIDYDVDVLGKVPGSYLTYSSSLNDHGVVVGMAMFIPGGLKAWTWTESQGFVLLPQPPEIDDYGAVDINNAGVIAGDGGGDSGQIWRYTNGTYEMLGVLPGTPIPQAAGLSETGSITGTCFGTLFYNPRHSFLAAPGAPMVSALDNSQAYYINDLDQITGSQSNTAYRLTPGQGPELLPPLGERFLTAGYSINNAGKVVGVAASLVEHSGVPFIYSDAAGMQEVGDFGGRAFARDINELDEVVGEWEPLSDRRPWVWSESQGVRFLDDVIDPGLGLNLRRVFRINNAGQIICDGRDSNSEIVQVLLTPIAAQGPGTAYCFGDGTGDDCPCQNFGSTGEGCRTSRGRGAMLSAIGSTSVAADDLVLTSMQVPPGNSGLLFVGDTQFTDSPLGDGLFCAGGNAIRYAPTVSDGQGTMSQVNPVANSLGLIQAGTSFNFQCWFRDVADGPSPCGSGFNLSNAYTVTFTP